MPERDAVVRAQDPPVGEGGPAEGARAHRGRARSPEKGPTVEARGTGHEGSSMDAPINRPEA